MLGMAGVKSELAAMYTASAELPLAQMRDRLSRRLDEIRGNSPVTDDRTFLLARRM